MGYNNAILFILVSLFFIQLKAQESHSNLLQYNQFSELTYQTTFDEGSSLNNAMLWKLHFGGFIDQSLKDENLKRLQNTQNLLGSQAQFKLDFRKLPDHFLKNGNIGYSVGIQYNIAQELNFTQDLYHLIFYGNKSLEGQTAYLSPTSVQNYDFAQLNFGLFKKDRDRKSELSVELSFNLGFRYQYIEVNDAQLFTQNQGNALEYSGDVLFRSSQEEGTAFKPNGYGAGIHLWYEKQWKLKHEIKIGLYNLGFLWWNSKSSLYHQTKSATFQGVEIDNIFNFNNPLDGTTLSDSALNYLRYHSTNQSFWLPTQALLQLQYRYALTAKLGLQTQLAHRFYSEYNTFLNVGLNRAFSPNLRLGVAALYGGYSGFNVGLHGRWKINSNFVLEFQSKFLSLLMPHYGSGVGFDIKLIQQL